MSFKCTAWNDGKQHPSGAGYGFKIPIISRDMYFRRDWKSVVLELPVDGGFSNLTLNVDKPSFWNKTCHELIGQGIGQWLRAANLAPWVSGHPLKFILEVVGERRFRLTQVVS